MSKPETPCLEGWQGYKSNTTRRYHFIARDGMALCRGLGFYSSSKIAHVKGQLRYREDCAKCYRLAEKRS